MRALPLVLALSACRFGFVEQPPVGRPSHVPEAEPLTGMGDLVLGTTVIDTTALTIDGAVPLHGTMIAIAQDGGGPELAVLHADRITVTAGAVVHVVGSRGLVMFATTIEIAGTVDAGAAGTRPGPGASPNAALPGMHVASDVCDTGGGGGGHGTTGGHGGDSQSCVVVGSAGGAATGDDSLAIRIGGGGCGAAVSFGCGNPAGGGGGGALQLSAIERVNLHGGGVLRVGGGGGSGGPECGDGDAGGGGGGGAGGALFIEAPDVTIDGLLFAHGGGGGAGGNGLIENGVIGAGGAGADGTTQEPAVGGAPPAPNAGFGGPGGTEGQLPGAGAAAEHNAGGGGGAIGRIVIRNVIGP
ncbi:hypothetical protein BH11MYX3_BH11MYX3_07470 [soil metagenome]